MAPRISLRMVGTAVPLVAAAGAGIAYAATRNVTYAVQLDEEADLSRARAMPRGADRRAVAWNELVSTAQRTQKPLLNELNGMKRDGAINSYDSMPLGNMVLVNVDAWRASAMLRKIDETGVDATPHRIGYDLVPSAVLDARDAVLRLLPDQKPKETHGWNVDQIRADELHDRGVDGSGVRVGVIDTGIDGSHEAFGQSFPGADGDLSYRWYDPAGGSDRPVDAHGHGTHVAGTVAGVDGDGQAIGAAPGADLMVARVLTGGSGRNSAPILQAMEWMLAPRDSAGNNPDPRRGADILSGSLSTPLPDPLMNRVVEDLSDAGMVPVFAAGNSGRRSGAIRQPGRAPASITVAATDANDKPASFTSRGDHRAPEKPDVAAPGVDVPSARPGGGYTAKSGTSMATPLVAGAAALVLSEYPDLTPEQVRFVLMESSVDIDPDGWDTTTGAGRIDIVRAMELAAEVSAGNGSQ